METLHITCNAATPSVTLHNTAASKAQPETIPDTLCTADCVLVPRDGHNTPLSLLYDGPYPVISRHTRFFTIQMGNRQDTIHVQRLSPLPRSKTRQATSTLRHPSGPRCADAGNRFSSQPTQEIFCTPRQNLH